MERRGSCLLSLPPGHPPGRLPGRPPGRRSVLGAGVLLAAPRVARAQGSKGQGGRVLRFVPSSDLAVLDPLFTTAAITASHGLMVFDTLYGVDEQFQARPQMVAGHTVEDDGLTWTLTLRDGLRFHDGEPVLARDAAASIRRWASRDMYGQEIGERADEITALDDRRLRLRLKRPFAVLPDALGKNGPSLCVVMPERLARTDADKQVTEMVGSGPYRFVAAERLAGARVVYQRFEGYQPRPDGVLSRMAGPKVAHFDRVEWHVIPDQATAAAALTTGEVDWVEATGSDVAPMLRRDPALGLSFARDPSASIMRFNWLQPPFDKPAVRRAFLGAVDQLDAMTAGYGTDPAAFQTGVGYFTSNSAMATTAGLEVLTAPRDMARVRRDLQAAGYAGERVVLLQSNDIPPTQAVTEVVADMLRKAGINLDVQTGDWGTISTRRGNRGPLDKGGWSVFVTGLTNSTDPGGHLGLRANGAKAWFGWPDSPRLETLRQDWFAAPDVAARSAVCESIQRQALVDVPYIPLGEYRTLSAFKRGLTGFGPGTALFYGVRWA